MIPPIWDRRLLEAADIGRVLGHYCRGRQRKLKLTKAPWVRRAVAQCILCDRLDPVDTCRAFTPFSDMPLYEFPYRHRA
jgi:hypothetical protein